MWLAIKSKDKNNKLEYVLYNRKPFPCPAKELNTRGETVMTWYNGSYHGCVYIPKRFNNQFKDLKFEHPETDYYEVRLVRDVSNPMFYVEKQVSSNGTESIFINSKLFTIARIKPNSHGFIVNLLLGLLNLITFGFFENIFGQYENYETVNCGLSSRIRPSEFKISVSDGIIPVNIKLKNKED